MSESPLKYKEKVANIIGHQGNRMYKIHTREHNTDIIVTDNAITKYMLLKHAPNRQNQNHRNKMNYRLF